MLCRCGQPMCTPRGCSLQPLLSSAMERCRWQMMSVAMPLHAFRYNGPCLTVPCPTHASLALPYPSLPCPALPCPALPSLALTSLALPCPPLPCFALPSPSLPCPALPPLPCPHLLWYLACCHVPSLLRSRAQQDKTRQGMQDRAWPCLDVPCCIMS